MSCMHVEKSRSVSQSSKMLSLEDEINLLRNLMEQTVGKEKSLKSEMVVRISTLLDHKINEYMKLKLKRAKT